MTMTTDAFSQNNGQAKADRERMLNDLDATDGGYDARTAIVGVTPTQPERVVATALRWAELGLIHHISFVFVDPGMSKMGGHEQPLDPDGSNDRRHHDASELSSRMTHIIHAHGVHATFRRLGGDPATELANEARKLGAGVIIVGTRERGPAAAIGEWIRGSVSVRLEHTQNVPVIVIPLGEHADTAHHPERLDDDEDAMATDAMNQRLGSR